MDEDVTWYGGRISPSDIVFDGDPAPPSQKRGQSPQVSAHVYCGQTAVWVKMSLGMQVGLGPGHIVLNGDAAVSTIGKKLLNSNISSTCPPQYGELRPTNG